MDPVRNPYAPGAGTPPPELAGRGDLINAGTTALRRINIGKPSQSLILVGLRGGGQTVLIKKLGDMAEKENFKCVIVEAVEGRSLPELLLPHLRTALYSLSRVESAKEAARRGLRALKGFLNGLRVQMPMSNSV